MGFHFYFNKKAWATAAKQLRIVSWALGGIVTAAGYQLSNGLVLVASGVAWFVLQAAAMVLESVRHTDSERSEK